MIIGSISSGQVASSVWASAARTLTGMGASVSLAAIANGSLAASTLLDVRPAANVGRMFSCAVAANAAAAVQVGLYDGSTFKPVRPGAAATVEGDVFFGNVTVGPAIQNGITNAVNYHYTVVDFKQ